MFGGGGGARQSYVSYMYINLLVARHRRLFNWCEPNKLIHEAVDTLAIRRLRWET